MSRASTKKAKKVSTLNARTGRYEGGLYDGCFDLEMFYEAYVTSGQPPRKRRRSRKTIKR